MVEETELKNLFSYSLDVFRKLSFISLRHSVCLSADDEEDGPPRNK